SPPDVMGVAPCRAVRVALVASLLLVAACSHRVVTRPAPDTTEAGPVASVEDATPARETKSALAQKADGLFKDSFQEGSFTGCVVVVDAGETVLEEAYGDADRKAA